MVSKLEHPEHWEKTLPMPLFAARDAPHSSTGFTPFELLFGWEVRGPTSILQQQWTQSSKTPRTVVSYLKELRQRLQSTAAVARTNDEAAKDAAKSSYGQGTREDELELGEEVLMLHPA